MLNPSPPLNSSSDGRYLATGSKGFNSVGCEVKVWDLRNTAAPCAELKGHSHDVVGVKYAQGGEGSTVGGKGSSSSGAGGTNIHGTQEGLKLISASKDGSIFIWDATNERYLTRTTRCNLFYELPQAAIITIILNHCFISSLPSRFK